MIDNNMSIEELEQDYWDEPLFLSSVIATCHKARKKPIKQLSHEEIRCLIAQKTGLKFIIPAAIEILMTNPFVEVTYYEGDLLTAILRLNIDDWLNNQEELKTFIAILRENHAKIEMSGEISDELIKKYF